jgi:hypothetical protein
MSKQSDPLDHGAQNAEIAPESDFLAERQPALNTSKTFAALGHHRPKSPFFLGGMSSVYMGKAPGNDSGIET